MEWCECERVCVCMCWSSKDKKNYNPDIVKNLKKDNIKRNEKLKINFLLEQNRKKKRLKNKNLYLTNSGKFSLNFFLVQ